MQMVEKAFFSQSSFTAPQASGNDQLLEQQVLLLNPTVFKSMEDVILKSPRPLPDFPL